MPVFQKLIAWVLVIIGACECLLPVAPHGKKLNLDGYTLIFEDEFDGDALDETAWYYRASGLRRCGCNAPSQVRLENGKLILKAEYRKEGEYGEGWYTGMIATKEQYTNGYFEITCQCSSGRDFWSAFWMQSAHSYEPEISQGGVGGAEIDIFEAQEASRLPGLLSNAVTSTVYCNGTDVLERIDRKRVGKFYVKNLYTEFHTFGCLWTESEYIFYIDGVESGRTSFGKGVSTAPEEVIVSLEIPEKLKFIRGTDFTTEFIVDSVRISQK